MGLKKEKTSNRIQVVLLIVCMVGFSYLIFRDVTKREIVYIDTVRLLNSYKGIEQAKAELEAKAKAYQGRLDTLQSEMSTLATDLNNRAAKLTARERKLMEDLINSKQAQIEQYGGVIKTKIQEDNMALTGKVLTRVNEFVKRYGESKGYRIILATSQSGNIVYGTTEADITDQIIKGLNEEYQTVAK